MTITTGTPTAAADILWTNPDTNLWVATVAGDYAGMIEFSDGHFVVHGHTGTEIATFSNIPAAKSALIEHTCSRTAPKAVRLLNSLKASVSANPFADHTPRPVYARGSGLAA